MGLTIPSLPHAFPRSGDLSSADTVVMVIDMQVEFCAKGGYVERLGRDLAPLRAPIEPIRRVLAAVRRRGFRVVHTREGYQPDLSDLQPWKRWDNPNDPIKVGDQGPLGRTLIRGEPCWDFIAELRPPPGERVFDKAGFGAFASTDLDVVLRAWGVQNLVLTGVTTDCCVHSTLREAVDRGYDCLVLEDCVGTSNRAYHEAALSLVRQSSGILGAVSDSATFVAAISVGRAGVGQSDDDAGDGHSERD
jgi:nicotinamidase-related amidase